MLPSDDCMFMAIRAYNLHFSSSLRRIYTLNIWLWFVELYGTFKGLNMSQWNRPVYRSGPAALVVLRVEHVQSALHGRVRHRLCGRQVHADHVPQVPRRARRRCPSRGDRGAHARLRFHKGPQCPADRPGHRGDTGALVLVGVAGDPPVARRRGAHVALRIRYRAVR